MVPRQHVKCLKTIGNKTVHWLCIVCITFLCISFFRNLKRYSSKQLKLIQILQVTMVIWVRKFFNLNHMGSLCNFDGMSVFL